MLHGADLLSSLTSNDLLTCLTKNMKEKVDIVHLDVSLPPHHTPQPTHHAAAHACCRTLLLPLLLLLAGCCCLCCCCWAATHAVLLAVCSL